MAKPAKKPAKATKLAPKGKPMDYSGLPFAKPVKKKKAG